MSDDDINYYRRHADAELDRTQLANNSEAVRTRTLFTDADLKRIGTQAGRPTGA